MTSERLTGETSLHQELEALSVSKRLVRSVSQKLKKKSHGTDNEDGGGGGHGGVSLRCLTLYGRGGGCRVGAATGDEFGDSGCRRRFSSASEDGKGYKPVCGTDDEAGAGADCFSYGVRERFWKKSHRKSRPDEPPPPRAAAADMHVFLPDDIVEMCLMRLPLAALMTARLVCRKWRSLTTTVRFMQTRRDGLHPSPWLFLFGAVKDGFCSREVHAFDVSLNKWHTIESEILKGRFLFSVANVHDEIFVVGGCSSLTNFGRIDRNSFKTHKSVLVFSPVTKSWRKTASMKHARSKPILGVYEVTSDCFIVKGQHSHSRHERRFLRARTGGASDVYEDPHRLSVRRQLRYSLEENEVSPTKPYKFVRQRSEHTGGHRTRFLLIAVGGLGLWDEPLDSCEVYDSSTNKWTETARVPADVGVVCSAVVCNGMFYVYSESDRLATYDVERGFWVRIQTTAAAAAPPRRVHEYHPKLITGGGGRLFMVSVSWCEGDGVIGRRNKAVRKLWELDLAGLTWAEASTHPDAPMDWNATFVADRNLVFGVEMFKIFGQVLDFLTVCDVSGPTKEWAHVSRNRVARGLDAGSCTTKTAAVVHL